MRTDGGVSTLVGGLVLGRRGHGVVARRFLQDQVVDGREARRLGDLLLEVAAHLDVGGHGDPVGRGDQLVLVHLGQAPDQGQDLLAVLAGVAVGDGALEGRELGDDRLAVEPVGADGLAERVHGAADLVEPRRRVVEELPQVRRVGVAPQDPGDVVEPLGDLAVVLVPLGGVPGDLAGDLLEVVLQAVRRDVLDEPLHVDLALGVEVDLLVEAVEHAVQGHDRPVGRLPGRVDHLGDRHDPVAVAVGEHPVQLDETGVHGDLVHPQPVALAGGVDDPDDPDVDLARGPS